MTPKGPRRSSVAALRAMIAAHHPVDDIEAQHRHDVLRYLDAAGEAILDRTCRPGHITGSAVVVNPERTRMVMLHHTKLDIWVQCGGHADGDADIAAVALREASEESGLTGLSVVPTLVDIDIHTVRPPTEDAHLHLDLRFVVRAAIESDLALNHESRAGRWVDAATARRLNPEPGMARLVAKALS